MKQLRQFRAPQYYHQKLLAFIPIFLVFAFFSAQAQNEETIELPKLFTLGGYGAYNLNMHSADFRALPGVPNCCPQYSSALGSGIAIGALIEYPMTSSLDIQFRVGYSMLGATLKKDEDIGNTYKDAGGKDVTLSALVQHSIAATVNGLSLEPSLLYRPHRDFFISLGIASDFLLTKKFDQKEMIMSPTTITFLDGRVIRNDEAGDIPDAASMNLSIVGGFSYESRIWKAAVLAPEIRYYLPLNDITSVSWKIAHLQVGASLKFPILRTYKQADPLEPGGFR